MVSKGDLDTASTVRSVIVASAIVCLTSVGSAVATVKVIESKLEHIEKTLMRHESEISNNRAELGETNKRQAAAIANREAYNKAIYDRLTAIEDAKRR